MVANVGAHKNVSNFPSGVFDEQAGLFGRSNTPTMTSLTCTGLNYTCFMVDTRPHDVRKACALSFIEGFPFLLMA